MKNFVKVLLGLIIIFFVGTFVFAFNRIKYEYTIGRYITSAPMEDLEYKKAIIRDSKNIFYKLENLHPLVGESELTEFIKNNTNNPEIYTPSKENIESGKYRANFHIHSTMSDGSRTVEERLNEAEEYAEKHVKDGYMYIAITDHNTVLGSKEIIKALQKYPERYKKIKVVTGLEIDTLYNNSKYTDGSVLIHVLAWCINPYDKYLNKAFYKKDKKDKWNRKNVYFDFASYIPIISEHAMAGIAHPAKYIDQMEENIYPYIKEFFDTYAKVSTKPLFVEGYYQSYSEKEKEKLYGDSQKFLNYITEEAKKRNISVTGSTDAHGKTIFKR